MEDQREILKNEQPFSYKLTKDGKAMIFWKNKHIMIIAGKKTAELIRAEQTKDAYGVQLHLAKLTGHFKHGNER